MKKKKKKKRFFFGGGEAEKDKKKYRKKIQGKKIIIKLLKALSRSCHIYEFEMYMLNADHYCMNNTTALTNH